MGTNGHIPQLTSVYIRVKLCLMRMEELRFKAARRRHTRGKHPCGKCQTGAHRDCRPRLDGTLCSCACERAKMAKGEFIRKCEAAKRAGQPQPTVSIALEILFPSLKRPKQVSNTFIS